MKEETHKHNQPTDDALRVAQHDPALAVGGIMPGTSSISLDEGASPATFATLQETREPAAASGNEQNKTQSTQSTQEQKAEEAAAAPEKKTKKRTFGLRVLDVGLYHIFTNAFVFSTSILATFLTDRGGDLKKNGKPVYGKIGQMLHGRGAATERFFQKYFKLSPGNANMAKMVTWSFLDGSLAALFVKPLEDRREKIAQWIDEKAGTVPENKDVYAEEPKQSWKSVILGRAVTAGVVVPTAAAMSNEKIAKTIFNSDKPLNDVIFHESSERHSKKWGRLEEGFNKFLQKITGVAPKDSIKVPKAGEKIASVAEKQGKTAFKTLAKMIYFEAFYTAVCTVGLYLSSRAIARVFNEWADKKAEKQTSNTSFKDGQETHHFATKEKQQPEERVGFAERVSRTDKAKTVSQIQTRSSFTERARERITEIEPAPDFARSV